MRWGCWCRPRAAPRGNRLYSEDDLGKLQQILIWRELGFALEQIRRILDDPGFDRSRALREQRKQLVERARRADAMIRSVDRALEPFEGEDEMDAKEIFDGFDPARYEDEARERWGDSDAYKEAARRTKRYTDEDWLRIKGELGDNSRRARQEDERRGGCRSGRRGSSWRNGTAWHIDRWFYPCSLEIHEGLAEMYLADERFASTIDKHGKGLTPFLVDAIRANAALG